MFSLKLIRNKEIIYVILLNFIVVEKIFRVLRFEISNVLEVVRILFLRGFFVILKSIV